jgi:hypothetical protein
MNDATLSPEFIANVRELSSDAICARLDALYAEERALRELLRLTRRRESAEAARERRAKRHAEKARLSHA